MHRALIGLALALVACGGTMSTGGTNKDGGGDTDPPPVGYAQIRVVHASPDAPSVDVYARGLATPLASNISYGNATDYAVVAAGAYTFDVRPAGAASDSTPAYTVGPVTVPGQARITAVAAGLLGSSDPQSSFRILPLVEQFASADAGTVRVRVVHLGADAPPVDIDVGDDGTSEVTGLARFMDTGADGVSLPASTALALGIGAGGSRVTGFVTPELGDGARLFVFAIGLLADTPREAQGFQLMTLDVSGTVRFVRQNPTVYLFHAAPDVRAIDVFAGQTKVVDDIVWGGLSAPVQLAPGSYTLDVFPHSEGTTRPGGTPVLSVTTPALTAGNRYLASAIGFANPSRGAPLQVIVQDDEFTTGQTLARIVHASPDAPPVDVGVATGSTLSSVLVSSLAYTQASAPAGIMVPSGTVRIGIAAAGSTSTVATFNVVVTAGERSFVLAAGALSPQAGEQTFGLLRVNTATSPWTATAVPQN